MEVKVKPLNPDAYALLRLVIELTPYTTRVISQTRLRDVNKWKRDLIKKGFMFITGEDGQWERMWPSASGRLMFEWQRPLMIEKAMPSVGNIYKMKGWEKDPHNVYIGRPGKGQSGYFGNPIEKGKECPVCKEVHAEPGDTLDCYEIWLRKKIAEDPEYRKRVRWLTGKTLVCFCHPNPCHGDVLARVCGEMNA